MLNVDVMTSDPRSPGVDRLVRVFGVPDPEAAMALVRERGHKPSGWKRSDARLPADLVIQAAEPVAPSTPAAEAATVARGVRNGMLQVIGIFIAAALLIGTLVYFVSVKPSMAKAAERERVKQVENDIRSKFR